MANQLLSVTAAAIANQPHNLPLAVTAETCSGRTYIVTGSNSGIGFEAAKHLVSLGAAKVVMAVRNTELGETAKTQIEAATGTSGIAEVWPLDLASYDSVKAFAKRAVTELDRIDALIENAAIATGQKILAEEHLLSITVNTISTFLLAVLLLPKMSESAQKFNSLPHIVIVTSKASFDFENDWHKVKEDPIAKIESDDVLTTKAYPLSKLMQIMAIRYLADLITTERTGVVVNTTCPGLCKTNLSRHAPPPLKAMIAEQSAKFGRTPEDGSRNLLYAAVQGKESHGRFLDSCHIADDQLPGFTAEKEFQKRTWEVIAQELEAIEPGCVKKVLEL